MQHGRTTILSRLCLIVICQICYRVSFQWSGKKGWEWKEGEIAIIRSMPCADQGVLHNVSSDWHWQQCWGIVGHGREESYPQLDTKNWCFDFIIWQWIMPITFIRLWWWRRRMLMLCNWKYFGTYLGILHISRDLVIRKVNPVYAQS